MANRKTTHVLKNSDIINKPLPSNLLKGEPIINTADGIMFFSGVTQSTSGWTQAGPTGLQQNFFEVGSNLYDLKLRNKITSYSGLTNLNGKFLSGTTNGFILADISQISSDVTITGGTYSNGTITLVNNTGGTISISGLTSNDTFITGFTYNPTQNKVIISQNQNQQPLDISINSVSGLTINDLNPNKLVYTTTNGKLITGNINFDGNNLELPSNGSLSVGSGGLTVNGDLTVLGSSISAFTSELYIEDSNIILNFNPSATTSASSIGAGLTIQDGNGISGGNVSLQIINLNSLTGLTSTEIPNISEYTGTTGNDNRGWITQLNDIILRNNNSITPNGVRVLTEFDILDGGQY